MGSNHRLGQRTSLAARPPWAESHKKNRHAGKTNGSCAIVGESARWGHGAPVPECARRSHRRGSGRPLGLLGPAGHEEGRANAPPRRMGLRRRRGDACGHWLLAMHPAREQRRPIAVARGHLPRVRQRPRGRERSARRARAPDEGTRRGVARRDRPCSAASPRRRRGRARGVRHLPVDGPLRPLRRRSASYSACRTFASGSPLPRTSARGSSRTWAGWGRRASRPSPRSSS